MFADVNCSILKLIDFGYAKEFNAADNKFKDMLGSPLFIAPEIVKKQPYDLKCDIWSCGIICYILLCGKIPYGNVENDNLQTLFNKIKSKEFSKAEMKEKYWEYISDEAKSFTLLMLQNDPTARPNAESLLKEHWISNAKDNHPNPKEASETMLRIADFNVNSL